MVVVNILDIIDDNIDNNKTVTGVQKKFSLDLHIKKHHKTIPTSNQEYIVKTQQENLNNIVYGLNIQ